jgi:hypothetical protein
MNNQEATLQRFKESLKQGPRRTQEPVKVQEYKIIYCLKNRSEDIVFKSYSEWDRDTEYLRLKSMGSQVYPVKYRKKI